MAETEAAVIKPQVQVPVEEPVAETVAVIEAGVDTGGQRLFQMDNFYQAHPGHILGERYVTSGRFGEVIKYKGDITALERIEVPLDFIGNQKLINDPILSTENILNFSGEAVEPATQDFIKQVNQDSEQAVRAKKVRREKAAVPAVSLVTEVGELMGFEQVYEKYNPEISREELEVFIWYKTDIGKPLSRRWARLLDDNVPGDDLTAPYRYEVTELQLKSWAERGLVFYYGDKFIPAFLYLSGDVYDRKAQLARDKQTIVERFGEKAFEAQERSLEGAFRQKYDKRLVIGAGDNQLIILPISKFAKEFFIERLDSMGEEDKFKVKLVSAQKSKNYGKPDFAKDAEVSEWNKNTVEKLSLTDSFSLWLTRATPPLKEQVNHLEIIKYYIQGSPMRSALPDLSTSDQREAERAQQAKLKASLQREGERLFKEFLDTQLTLNDRVRLETEWNSKFNNYLPINYNKVPVAFTMAKYYLGKEEVLRPEKREAVAFCIAAGAACLAFDVGVGKTPSAIFTISAFLDAGYCQRPFICVPNQVYKQFMAEIKGFAPHIPVLEAYNFGDVYVENFRDASGAIAKVPAGTITLMTYEGLEQVGFSELTEGRIFESLFEILNQGGESERKPSQRNQEGFKERLQTLMGRGLRGSLYNIEDFGFDFGCYDEAHKLKKVFTAVKGEETKDAEGGRSREKNPYVINSGVPSAIGLKAFMLNQYILRSNGYQNVLLLTATPFTNSPLEIFSMLSMLAYQQLQSTDLQNIKNFFDTYVATSTDLVINAKLKPEFKQIIVGFNNLISLQTLIRRYINYKTGEDVNVVRPNKWVLPLLRKNVNGDVIVLGEEEKVETYIAMTPQQQAYMSDIVAYAEEKISFDKLQELGLGMGKGAAVVTEEGGDRETGDDSGAIESQGEEVDEDDLGDEEKKGVKILRSMNFARNLALSPFLYEFSGMGKPDAISYIETSPKLKYVIECVRTVKKYHEDHGEPVSGQVIYMDRGIEHFGLIREYLISEVGYKPHEVGIIKSGMAAGGKKGSKEYIKNLFNGEIYNEATRQFDLVDDGDRIKVIIGSSTIKEGINLQRYGTVLYNCFIDWNPTDMQQLEGRIWRQKNTFSNVRICIPLVLDSMDIFIFQKLQEKTARLNTIWSTDGKKNVLNLEEFDPAELKYALIRDPSVVAELKILDLKAELESEILGISRLSDRISRIEDMAKRITRNFKDAVEEIRPYRNFEASGDKLRDALRLVQLTQDVLKKQTDKSGKPMVYSHERQRWKDRYGPYGFDRHAKDKPPEPSELDPLYKPYWFDDFNLAQRNLNKEVKEFIAPAGIQFNVDDLEPLKYYAFKKQGEVEALRKQQEALESDENKKRLIEDIIAEREAKHIAYRPLMDSVAQFTRLNYLLSDKVVSVQAPKPAFTAPPPMAGGVRMITPEAIRYLEETLAALPQTRAVHAPAGIYSEERQQLHKKIVADLLRGVRCVKNEKPIAVFTGGAPGSGKTNFLKRHAEYLLTPEVFHIDADELREKLPGYEGWNASVMHQERQDIVSRLLDQVGGEGCKYDFVYDGTMNKAQKYFSLIRKVKEMGYRTFILFMDVPYHVSRARVLERYQRKGRYVTEQVINEFFEKLPGGKTRGQDALDQLKGVVDGYIVVNGETGDIMERGGEELPKDRSYDGLFLGPSVEVGVPTGEAIRPRVVHKPIETAPAAAAAPTRAEVKSQIEALKLSMKYLSGEERQRAKDQVEALQLSVKYLAA